MREGGQDYAHQAGVQPPAFAMRFVEAGYFTSLSAARAGRGVRSPPQLGHLPLSVPSAQDAQKVHSNEQMRASVA